MKLLSLVFFLVTYIKGFAHEQATFPPTDTTIIKQWLEGKDTLRIEIKLINAAGPEGVIPGQRTESYIQIRKSRITGSKTKVMAEKKDTCDPQSRQLRFHTDCVEFVDLDRDGKMELIVLYEFGGDGMDDRPINYLLIEGNKIHLSPVLMKYKQEGEKYRVSTSLVEFNNAFPPKFEIHSKKEYKRIVACLEK